MKMEIPQELKIFNIGENLKIQREFFNSGRSEDDLISFVKLQDFDGAGLQLLVWLCRQAANIPGIRIEVPSNMIVERLKSYGFRIDEFCERTGRKE
ncbi:MAG: hypothetical protein JEZ04_09790 [Spirochaetales bacterium]|nr:hypothetical protein [Spirochaetales bacterium]